MIRSYLFALDPTERQGITIRCVGVRPWRLLPTVKWFPTSVTLTGGRCTMLLPPSRA